MIWSVALTLGLLGSMHCIGMCGPIAITFCSDNKKTWSQSLSTGLLYNIGRVMTYMAMGLIFGLIGNLFVITKIQSFFSFTIGIILILAFLFSWNIDNRVNSTSFMVVMNNRIRSFISQVMNHGKDRSPLVIGMANGLLPCGLVYLAISGSIASGSPLNGMLFMGAFGMGTMPALLILTTGSSFIDIKWQRKLRGLTPYVQLGFGIFLIFRGLMT